MEKYLLVPISICGFCLLIGCGTSSPPPLPITVTISPGSAVALDVNQILPVTANVSNDFGNHGFDWALTCGGGNCGTITAHTASGAPATFTAPAAPPSVPVTITATLSGKTDLATTAVTVSAAPTVTTTGPLTAAILGNPYSLQLVANGGIAPLTWALGGGTSLPDSLSLNGTGVIAGTPSGASATFNFKVHVTDSAHPQLTSPDVTLSISIAAPPILIGLSPASAYVKLNGSKEFVANLTNDQPGGKVDWTIALNGMSCPVAECGSVSPMTTTSGTPTTYTAPANVLPENITLTATSVDGTPPATASAVVTIGTHSFVSTGSMGAGRTFQTATLLGNGTVLIEGGIDSKGNAVASTELFDSSLGTFAPTGSMQTGRSRHTATLLKSGKVLVTGGLDNKSLALASAELFDSATGTFTPTSGRMVSRRAYHTATLLNDGTVLIAGGFDGSNDLATAELFDPATGTFTPTKGSMDSPRYDHTAMLLDHGSTLTNGKVLVIGGSKPNRTQYATAELFDPATGTFTLIKSSMESPRAFHTATLLTDGTVLVAGGRDTLGVVAFIDFATAEIFDPNTELFTHTKGSMGFARESHTATLLSDGTVLVTGGFDRNTPLATAELFDPVSGSFTRTADMDTTRADHTATLLKDGTVLVTGGVDGSGTALTTSELYQ